MAEYYERRYIFVNIQPIDWSATAAWIAVIISIIGASVGPFFTACINNKHQLKLRELDIKEKELSEYNAKRRTAIENFLSSTSRYLSDGQYKNIEACGENFFQVYPYIPKDLWGDLNNLYTRICQEDILGARASFLRISNRLAEILAEPLQISR